VFGFEAALAAYRECGDWLASQIEYLRANRDLVERAIGATPGLKMAHVEATYLAWIGVRRPDIKDPAALFEHGGVGLYDGRVFGTEGYVRLNFVCPRSLLRRGLDRMKDAMTARTG
jgi:cystathionine beta-lyase